MEYKRKCPKCGKELEYKSYSAWYNANKKESLCRSCGCKKDQEYVAKLEKLLDESNEAYYWMGFILADGCLSNNRLSITLSEKDSIHLQRLGEFLEYTGSYGSKNNHLACKNSDIVPLIKEKFNIKDEKTYNPPESLAKFSDTQKLCMLIGFIDGDGNISHFSKRPDFFLRIKNHHSWENILKEFSQIITGSINNVKINNQGYAELQITNSTILQDLKSKMLKLNIPYMERKWDIINMNFISKYTTAEILRNKVLKLHNDGLSKKEISEKCNTSLSNTYKIIKNYC